MARKYINHLIKLNVLGNGSIFDLWRSVAAYNLKYFFWRPWLVNKLRPGKFRNRKKLLYTILVDEYDHLNEIPRKKANWDYVCFTDNPDLKSDTWEIRLLKNPLDLDPTRLSRYYKIHNHLIDQTYDISVYVDANFRIRGDLDCFLENSLADQHPLSIMLHPFHHSLTQEVELCMDLKKDKEELLQAQYDFYVNEQKFMDTLPHIAASVIIRQTRDPNVIHLMEVWFKQLVSWSKRDQVAFNYSLSRCPNVGVNYIHYYILRRYFKKLDHRKKKANQKLKAGNEWTALT